jgi:hypothetical protein
MLETLKLIDVDAWKFYDLSKALQLKEGYFTVDRWRRGPETSGERFKVTRSSRSCGRRGNTRRGPLVQNHHLCRILEVLDRSLRGFVNLAKVPNPFVA